MSKHLFKIQRPLSSSDEQGMTECLVYNEDRSIMGQIPMSKDIFELFGDEVKLYVKGSMSKAGTLNIDAVQADWPDW